MVQIELNSFSDFLGQKEAISGVFWNKEYVLKNSFLNFHIIALYLCGGSNHL